jgi:peptide/nickel transport system permease protein
MNEATTWLFGIDEFGRYHLAALAAASVLSVARALMMSTLLLLTAASLVVVVEVKRLRIVGSIVQMLVDALESVPIYIWVLAGIASAPRYGLLVVTAVFVLAGLPIIFNAIRGTVGLVMKEPYFMAAIALGSSDMRIIMNHIVPNTLPHCAPLFIHVLGSALAVYGGIGVFGFINRESLDLGVFLLRGKEQAGLDPMLLLLTLAAYAVIFLALQAVLSVMPASWTVVTTKRAFARTTE